MYNLTFDTTAAGCAIALMKDNKKIALFRQTMDFGQAEVLLPQVQKILQNAGVRFDELDLLTVCVGPGSFTGVRASISAARAFGVACPNLTLAGVSAFEAYVKSLVWNPEEIAEVNAVIIETKRDDFYVQIFDKNLHKISEPQALHYEDILPLLRDKKVTLVGDGVERFLAVPHNLSLHAILPSNGVDVEDLARVGYEDFCNKKTDFPKPLYLRAPDVCLKKKQA